MSFDQTVALVVLVGVVAGLVRGKWRPDVVALAGAATLLATGVIRPVEVQAAFASPAIIALASLFVIAYAIELSGMLSLLIRSATWLCARMGSAGLWVVIGLCGFSSAFLNNTPIVVLGAPVVRDVSRTLNMSPQRFLIPLSYATVLAGSCTLIGTSTNLLVNDMARNAGQPTFGLFEITPAAAVVAAAGLLYLVFAAGRLLTKTPPTEADRKTVQALGEHQPHDDASLGDADMFTLDRPLDVNKALAAMAVFTGVVIVAALGLAPIAAAAFAGAVLLIVLRVIGVEDAYRGLKPDVLLLIAGMVVVGLSLEITGLAASATGLLIDVIRPLGPLAALIILYGATLLLTEILSNAAVAVLITPIAVAMAESLGVDPRPFLVAVMLAASLAFATPFGYQTNVLVFQMGRYRYMDFVRIGVPLNLLTWAVAAAVIPMVFPF
jgi:di/tricarboxylate transporter